MSEDEGSGARLETASKVIAGAVMGGIAVRYPELGIVTGGALVLGEQFVRNVLAEWQPDGVKRTADVLDAASEVTGLEPGAIASLAVETEESRLLAAQVIFGAFGTAWPHKVRALGRLLGEGLIAADDKVDIRSLALPAVLDMERPHVDVLDLLARHRITMAGQEFVAEPVRVAPLGDKWHPASRWAEISIAMVRPQLKEALSGVLGTLQRHGLVVENDSAADAITRLIKNIEADSRAQARNTRPGSQPRPLHINPVTPNKSTWSVTEFGQRVLGFYQEAAAGE
jgi:hypothetical protein